MNGVREEYSIKVKQTSKGIWFCDGLQVIAESTDGLASDLGIIMHQVETVLAEHNFVEPVEVTPKIIEEMNKKVQDEYKKFQKKGGEK